MRVTVEYTAQLKAAAGTGREELEVNGGCTPAELVRRIAARHGAPLGPLLLDADGDPRRSILIFIGDNQIRGDVPIALRDRDVVTLLAPVSGG